MFANRLSMLVIAGIAAAVAGSAYANATKDDAIAFMNRAKAHYDAVGRDQALKDFSANKDEWVVGEVYIFCNDYDGLVTAHGTNVGIIGKNFGNLKDADGKLFVQEIMKVGKQGGGWVDYRWANPTTKKIEAKTSLVEDFGPEVCGVGIYK